MTASLHQTSLPLQAVIDRTRHEAVRAVAQAIHPQPQDGHRQAWRFAKMPITIMHDGARPTEIVRRGRRRAQLHARGVARPPLAAGDQSTDRPSGGGIRGAAVRALRPPRGMHRRRQASASPGQSDRLPCGRGGSHDARARRTPSSRVSVGSTGTVFAHLLSPILASFMKTLPGDPPGPRRARRHSARGGGAQRRVRLRHRHRVGVLAGGDHVS